MNSEIWTIVLVSVITFTVMIGLLMTVYTFISARNIKKQRSRMPDLVSELKPGTRVMFAGGFIGTIVSKDENFAKVKIDDKTVVEVAVYSISTILV